MAPDLSRRMFIGAAASSAAVALTANGSAAIGSEALRCIAFEPGKIPDKPDPTTQPALSKAWERMFESQLEWVAPDLCDLVKKGDLDIIVTPEVHRFLEAATTRYENSGGWCGASIVPDGGNQFVQIYGEFTVPEANIPPDGTNSKYYSATWIGLDGDRRYIDFDAATGRDPTEHARPKEATTSSRSTRLLRVVSVVGATPFPSRVVVDQRHSHCSQGRCDGAYLGDRYYPCRRSVLQLQQQENYVVSYGSAEALP